MKFLSFSLLLLTMLARADATAVRALPPTSLALTAERQLSYAFTSGDFSCAIENRRNEGRVAKGWNFDREAPNKRRQSIDKAWEPVLEPVPGGCTRLQKGWTRSFSFLIVLDKSWVQHYRRHRKQFATQGYKTLKHSPFLLIDRVDYLFKKQFGISITASKVVALPNLEDACEKTEGNADGKSRETNTLMQLRAAGHFPIRGDGNIIRLGTGSLTEGVVCDSWASSDSLCDHEQIMVSHELAFTSDGRLNYEATKTLAHELGHIFAICDGSSRHCQEGHTANEFPDIMVWNGELAESRLPNGLLFKFLTTCTPVYRDLLCKRARQRKCGTNIPPSTSAGEPNPSSRGKPVRGLSLVGKYFAKANSPDDPERDDWHDVRVTNVRSARGKKYWWKNAAGVSWVLTRRSDDPYMFDVSKSSPYYEDGYTVAEVEVGRKDGKEIVTGIYGPNGDLYERV